MILKLFFRSNTQCSRVIASAVYKFTNDIDASGAI